MLHFRLRAVALLLLAITASCRAPTPTGDLTPVARPDPSLQALLDPRPAAVGKSWLGADVASSAPLTDDRIVWIFGDTLLGSVSDTCPAPETYCDRDVSESEADGMIASTVAIMMRGPTGAPRPMHPYWPTRNDQAQPTLPTLVDGEFLWPMAIVSVNGTLIVSASRHTRETGLYSLGSVLLRVRNPNGPPSTWHWETHPVEASHPAGEGIPQLTWMSALVPQGGWIYVFGERSGAGGSETLLARFAASDVSGAAWAPRLEFLADDGETWASAYDPAHAWIVPGLPGTTETTVHWDRRLGWYSFRLLPLTFDIRLFTAERLAGPWRDRGVAYTLPARWRTPRRPDGAPMYAAYAVKAHPWLSDDTSIVLTYNVNLLDGTYESAAAAAERESAFYVPQVVRVAPWGD